MKILFTGGGTGGHFYPLIAVAQKVHEELDKKHVYNAKFYYMSTEKYDEEALSETQMNFIYVPAGKMRIYFSLQNFIDLFKTGFGVLIALYKMFKIYPDVVFSKGCYASFPALFAARILRIPVVIHESDMAPGRVTKWSARFAKRIAVSYPELVNIFGEDKTAWTGQPIREEIVKPVKEGAYEYLKLNPNLKTIFVLGGSLGAQKINDCILSALPELVKDYQIIHQTGKANYDEVFGRSKVVLFNSDYAERYHPFPFLNSLAMKMCAGASDLIITRAGSSLFEIACWGVPSVIVPITNTNGDHQRKNAYAYARSGSGLVLEESNLGASQLIFSINDILGDTEKYQKMQHSAIKFSKPDASSIIASEIVNIALSHEE